VRLSIVVPVWNRADRARVALDCAARAVEELGLEAELVVVDDASTDGADELVEREFPGARLLRNERNRGFAVTANRGMAAARGELLLLLNSDTELGAEALGALVAALEAEPGLDLVAPRLTDADGTTQTSCMAFPSPATALWFGSPLERWFPRSRELRRYRLDDFDHRERREDLQPPAACWLLRREVWERVGPFDEGLELFFNDVDWCRRLLDGGGRLAYLPEPWVVHHEGSSTSLRTDFVPRWHLDRLRYHRKHHGRGGAALVKLVVTWTYLDWLARNGLRRLAGRDAEPAAPLSRALASFLRS
jgi:GT2 family glycosyltransferase